MATIIEMVDPQKVILRELASGMHSQKSIALTYAFVMRQEGESADYRTINSAIMARWPKGLERVKKMAWKFMREGIVP